MMTLAQLQELKRQLGMTNEDVARMTGVALSTVQKVFGGTVKSPRRKTLEALSGPMVEAWRKTLILDHLDYLGDSWEEGLAVSGMGKKGIEKEGSELHSDGFGDEPGKLCETVFQYIPNPTDIKTAEGVCRKDRFGGLIGTQREYTVEDLSAWPEEERVELINGKIYSMGTPSVNHQRLVFHISRQLFRCIEEHGADCEVLVAPVGVQLDRDDRTMVEPDVLIVCDETKITDRCILGAPDFVLEVLSSTSRSRDIILKNDKYYSAGCREYWIVDPLKEEVIVHDYEREELDVRHTFEDQVPVRMSEGECVVDFSEIRGRLK